MNLNKDQALEVVFGGILIATIAHQQGWLPTVWDGALRMPEQIQANLAALRPTPAVNRPDPSAPPLVEMSTDSPEMSTDSPEMSTDSPEPSTPSPQAINPVRLPDSAKLECQGSVGDSATPFSFDQFVQLRAVLGDREAVKPGNSFTEVSSIIGNPVCQLPTLTVAANYPAARFRWVGVRDGQVFELIVAFRNQEATHWRISPLK